MFKSNCRQCVMVYRILARKCSQDRSLTVSINGIFQAPYLLSSFRVVLGLYSRYFTFVQVGHVIFRNDRHPILNLIFQGGSENVESFTVGVFHFWLLDAQPQIEKIIYIYTHTHKHTYLYIPTMFLRMDSISQWLFWVVVWPPIVAHDRT
jgi:hypothetical protein